MNFILCFEKLGPGRLGYAHHPVAPEVMELVRVVEAGQIGAHAHAVVTCVRPRTQRRLTIVAVKHLDNAGLEK